MIKAILVQMSRKRHGCVFKIVRERDAKTLTYAKDFNAAHMIADIEQWDIVKTSLHEAYHAAKTKQNGS